MHDTAPGIRNVIGWAYRYCSPTHNGFGTDWTGADERRLPELHDLLRQYVYVRRERKQIGNLPDGNFLIQDLALNGAMGRYSRLQREFLQVLFEEKGPEAMNRAARAEALQRMLHLRIEAGKAKAQAVCEHVQDLLNDGKQVVLMYEHTQVRDEFVQPPGQGPGPPGGPAHRAPGARRHPRRRHLEHGEGRAHDDVPGRARRPHAGPGDLGWHRRDPHRRRGDGVAAASLVGRAVRPGLRADPALRRHVPGPCGQGEDVNYHVLNAAFPDGTETMDTILWRVLVAKATRGRLHRARARP